MTEVTRQAGEDHQQTHDHRTAQRRVTAALGSFAVRRSSANEKPAGEPLLERLIC